MEQTDFAATDPLKTWGLLVALLLVGALAVALGLPRGLALWVIFAAAIAEAYVIGRYYMRLRSEDVLIYTRRCSRWRWSSFLHSCLFRTS